MDNISVCGVSVYFSTALSLSTVVMLLPAILLTLLYSVKLPILKATLVLREVPYIKLFLIAFVWSIVTVAVVANEHHMLFSWEVLMLFLSRFFFVIAITIPFDIRDMKVDSPLMKTIPQRFGMSKAIFISITFLAAFEVFAIAHFIFFDVHFSLLVALLACSLCSAYVIYNIDHSKTNFYYSFWIEGTSLLYACIIVFYTDDFWYLRTLKLNSCKTH